MAIRYESLRSNISSLGLEGKHSNVTRVQNDVHNDTMLSCVWKLCLSSIKKFYFKRRNMRKRHSIFILSLTSSKRGNLIKQISMQILALLYYILRMEHSRHLLIVKIMKTFDFLTIFLIAFMLILSYTSIKLALSALF